MREFWDERAREDAFYFVDNRIRYKDPAEEERFWEMGRSDLDKLLGAVDVGLEPEWVVVEIGCGVGRLTRVVAGRVGAVKAVDVSAEMLSIAWRIKIDWSATTVSLIPSSRCSSRRTCSRTSSTTFTEFAPG